MSRKKTIIICAVVLLVAAAVTLIIFLTEPTAQREGATKETAMLVQIDTVYSGDFQPVFVATGTVQPALDIVLSPRVSGEVIDRSESFVPGGIVEKGELLLQIDPADFENTLQLRKSDLQQQQADLSIEMGQQQVAQQDYQYIADTISEANEALVLREPQLNAVQARVKAARAAVRQAELNLDRTSIRAPFDAHIISRNTNVGSQVAPGDNLGRLVGIDEYWVVITVPVSKIRWISFPDRGSKGSEVRITSRTAWEKDEFRIGYVSELIGALEDQTRLARIIVTVPDPHLQKGQSNDLPRLMVGAFMETHITADTVSDVIRVSRDHLRKDETVWVMEDGKLRIHDVDIAVMDAKYAFITDGLKDGDQVVTTNLSTVTDGARLRLETDTIQSENGTHE